MGAGHSAEGEGGAYASDPPAQERRRSNNRRRRHSVDSVASYSSQNHVDRIRTQNFSAASCQDESDSIKSKNLRRSSLEFPNKRPESVTSNTSSTRSRLRELVERKSQDEHKAVAHAVGDIQYFDNPSETLEFDKHRKPQEKKTCDDRPKKRKLTKSKDKEKEVSENKKQEKYQSKLAEYYKLPVQLPQDEFYQHLTRSKAAEDLLQKRFANSDTEFNGSYGRLCKHKESEGSNLRRSRSLAVIREETFTDLQLQNHSKNKRSQLIPRARLFDKPCFKDRLTGRAKYQTKEEVLEGIYIDSTASCFGEINRQRDNEHNLDTDSKSDKEDAISRNESNQSRSIAGSWPNLTDENQRHINLSEDSIGHSRNPSEIDSLDSNYIRKHYNFEAQLKNSYKDSSPETERSAVTPDNNKDIYINTENKEIESDIRGKSSYDTQKSFTNDSISITQSEKTQNEYNTVDLTNDIDSYDEISLSSKKFETTKNLEVQSITKSIIDIPKEADDCSVLSENDGTISSPPDSITSYISISIPSSADKSHKLEYLANSLAEKIDEYCESQFKENLSLSSNNINDKSDVNPIYTKVTKKRTFADTKKDKLSNTNNSCSEIQKKRNDVYITNTYIERNEFVSQNKRLHCTSSKNITTEPFVTTLIENQYYSLPDINISKCLRKSERIDAKLREEDPEDPCENTYEIADTDFRDIIPSENYGQLNHNTFQTHNNNNNQIRNFELNKNSLETSEYPQPHLIQNFTRLEDDLKSIITVNSSDKDINETNDIDTQQNEREINEIEGTIRNNKLITKSESLKLTCSAGYRFGENKLITSVSHDKINQLSKEKKPRTGIRKHYSLRQREPSDGEIDRLPSPATVERTLNKKKEIIKNKVTDIDTNKAKSLLTRVQSFKTSTDTNIAIVPLSGHQTIIIDPPLNQNQPKDYNQELKAVNINYRQPSNTPKLSKQPKINEEDKILKESINKYSSVDTSSYYTPKDPFITIKLNKVVKTTIPKLKKETSEKIATVQYKFEKPPSRLIIKDNKNNIPISLKKTSSINMTRPQVMQVVDSKNNKQNNEKTNDLNSKEITQKIIDSEKCQKKDEIVEQKLDNISVKEKIKNAIKTDIEYQEKLHSVKNYWSKLIDNTPENKLEINENLEDSTYNKNRTTNKDELNEELKSHMETTVGNIIKSIESVKIVDSIRKISQTKLQLWKDESEKVKDDSEIEETTVKKIIKDCEEILSHENKTKLEKSSKKSEIELCTRDTPEIEIVELSSDDNQNQKTQATLIKAKGYEKGCDDFDHVRYKVMKSELFKNSMIANYRKEAQFDGLLQYLQDYSFQELLVNNNIVIIEPVRTKIEPAPRKSLNSDTCKISPSLLKKNENNPNQIDKSKNAVRRHFFYHPIRVNKEIIEEELPNPDTVKKVRNLFEDTLKMKSPMAIDPPLVDESSGLTRRATSYRNINEDSKGNKIGCRKKVIRQLTIDTSFGNGKKWDNASLSSGVSSGDLSSNNEYEHDGLSPFPHKNIKDNVYSSSSEEYLCDSVSHDFCCESQYVSPDILKKIRECGTSITYYGGKVLNSKVGSTVSPMTKAIMDEIKGLQKNCSRDCYLCQTKCRGDKCLCLVADKHKTKHIDSKQFSTASSDSGNQDPDKSMKCNDSFPGFKFKLVKSNSCSSRLELTGTDENKISRCKYRISPSKTEDPPLVTDDENSVKNKICRLESYNKGIAKTPFESKDNEETKTLPSVKIIDSNHFIKTEINAQQKALKISTTQEQKINQENKQTSQSIVTESENEEVKINDVSVDKANVDPHIFEKKFYYVNDNLDQSKSKTGKFGEMIFEEFEVLESSYDSLNSNKSTK